jgi:thioesterase domain-containing protein
MGEDQPVYGLQAQGLDGQRPILTSVEEMAELYLQEVKTIQPQGPYLVGGYCMGGSVALEMAQRLRAQGEEVALVALFETYNWRHMKIDSPWVIAYSSYQKILFHLRNFLLLDSAKKLTFFREKYKVLQERRVIWAGALQAKLRRNHNQTESAQLTPARLWATNDQAALDYQPRPYPGKITHFRPRSEYAIHMTPGLEWDELAEGGVETHRMNVYPAGMLVEPFVGQLAVTLRECITRGLAEGNGTANVQVNGKINGKVHAMIDGTAIDESRGDVAYAPSVSAPAVADAERETWVF